MEIQRVLEQDLAGKTPPEKNPAANQTGRDLAMTGRAGIIENRMATDSIEAARAAVYDAGDYAGFRWVYHADGRTPGVPRFPVA